jgi:hypothetical protein
MGKWATISEAPQEIPPHTAAHFPAQSCLQKPFPLIHSAHHNNKLYRFIFRSKFL